MVGTITSLGTPQVIPDQSVKGTSVIIGTTPVVLLTIATGKKAKITAASFAGTSYGAGTYIKMLIAGVEVRRTAVIENAQVNSLPGSNPIILTAGQTITLSGDSAANNESAEYIVTYQELPA